MNTEHLEKTIQSKGLDIVKILINEYEPTDFEINSRDIEKEIYDISTSYSKILFFESKHFFSESVRNETKTYLTSRFDRNQVFKMNDIDLVAHWIKLEVIKQLENREIFLM
jgi:hypothetical protein